MKTFYREWFGGIPIKIIFYDNQVFTNKGIIIKFDNPTINLNGLQVHCELLGKTLYLEYIIELAYHRVYTVKGIKSVLSKVLECSPSNYIFTVKNVSKGSINNCDYAFNIGENVFVNKIITIPETRILHLNIRRERGPDSYLILGNNKIPTFAYIDTIERSKSTKECFDSSGNDRLFFECAKFQDSWIPIRPVK